MTTGDRIWSVLIIGLLSIVAQTWASGRISQIRVAAGAAELTVETVADERYQLQCSTNLAADAWTDVDGEFIAVAATTERSAPVNASNCYFRVVIIDSGETDGPTSPSSPPPPPPGS